ncbi:MAG: zf-TFIIB domain-containing protein [Patescibacteria group bacterium]|nr:zf-TFIIB domain-containing protein [Patescibacteria group bacterium]
MKCPLCKRKLKKEIFYGTEIDYCPKCLGLWFEQDELREAKDEKDEELNWLDISLWQEETRFKISKSPKLCPVCAVPLYQANYGDSKIRVDLCNLCQGIWLDRGEFKKIIDYLRRKGQYEILQNYFKNLIKEGIEIFTGPENFRSELADFLTILKIFNYKFASKFPKISKIILDLPK